MNDYTVPPDSTTPPSAAPPPPPPPAKSTPWGKIVLFGCLGLFLIGLVITGIGVVIYMSRDRDGIETYEVTEGEDGGTNVSGGGRVVHRGTLGAGDNMAPDGSWYDEYPVDLSAGDRLVVTLESSDFDAYLTVIAPSGAMVSDDDGGGGTNSRVEREVDESGRWNIHANTLRPAQTGSYTLTIETQ